MAKKKLNTYRLHFTDNTGYTDEKVDEYLNAELHVAKNLLKDYGI